MSEFRYASLIVLVAIFYIFVMLLIELPSYNSHYSPLYPKSIWKFDWDFFNSCSMSFFAFSNQIEAINIQNEMRKFTARRAHKMVLYSILINFFFYLGVAFAGYFSTFDGTAQIVIDRPPLPPKRYHVLLLIAQFAVVLELCIAGPINTCSMKAVIIHQVWSEDHELTLL